MQGSVAKITWYGESIGSGGKNSKSIATYTGASVAPIRTSANVKGVYREEIGGTYKYVAILSVNSQNMFAKDPKSKSATLDNLSGRKRSKPDQSSSEKMMYVGRFDSEETASSALRMVRRVDLLIYAIIIFITC
jgi:hypothetical protein